MKSLALASLSALAAPFGVSAAEPAEERAAWRCKVEAIRNVSTAENLPVAQPLRVFAAGNLEERDGRLVLEEVVSDEHSESLVMHSIDPGTGRYEAVVMRTDHAMGEQYQIESAGSCERLASEGEGAE
ncbi:hypothetical protein H0274_06220 [Altererythrobacter sp. CC-YST694]|uniref:hypothetical protein n=1 Tax=Altererythrobacter sp. CC-YST694 TaxID=2755038 RepID=UPI001D02AF73|nr:hypothetical protein [Altererythrobacter sp. CC-YST694]MCB5424842.1 hypothetical protein [Altererythrobacter sp. CC-YST694]